MQCTTLIITSLINTINRYKLSTKQVFFVSIKDWIFRPHFAADMQIYLNANFNLYYSCEVKSNRKIVTGYRQTSVLEGNLVLKSSVCSEGITVIFAMARIRETCLYYHCGSYFLQLGKGGLSFCVLNWNENPAAATELPVLFETG